MMKRLSQVIQSAFVLLILTGCVNTQTVDVDPTADLSSLETFYVVKLGADERGVHKLIAERLNAMGKVASFGTDSEPPGQVDAVVSYEDKWMWDLTMYMIELRIDIRHPETNYKLATASSHRTSLVRKSPEGMVEEVLNTIFAGQ